MVAEGHQVASHTWSHENLDSLSPALRRQQFIYNEIAFVGVIGVIPTYFRPPYTVCNGECYAELGSLGYKVVNYDVDPRDWENEGVNARATFTKALDSGAQSEWLVLAHDVQPNTVNGFAQFMIDKARALGFEIVPAGECLGDPETNWYRDPKTGAARSARGAGPVEPEPPKVSTSSTSSGSTATTTSTSQKKVVVTPTPVPTFKVTELPRNSTTSASSTVSKSSSFSTSATTTGSSTGTGTPSPSPSQTGGADLARPGMWLGLLGLGLGLVLA